MSNFSELKQTYRRLGPIKFWSTMAAIIAWCVLGVWLSDEVSWPDSYGYHCHGRGCFFSDLWHSPALVERGGVFPDAMFLYLWSFIAIPVSLVIGFKLRKQNSTISSSKLPDREY